MQELTATTILDGLVFPECPRWRDGELWFSDVHAHRIVAMTADNATRTVYEHDGQPAGLGWTPDGALLFASMVDRTLRRLADGKAEVVADLSPFEKAQVNDMVVDARGRAYVGCFGFDINTGEPFRTASVVLVDAGGSARVAADEMRFPNGMVITPDGRTLIVAETVGRCLTAFDIAGDGSLSHRRAWADVPTFPDGICLDAEGAVWVAGPATKECIRVREGGEVTHRVRPHGERGVYACALGGNDGRTLYLCTADTTGPQLAQGISTGWLEAVQVEVPGA